jgi:MFS family permease
MAALVHGHGDLAVSTDATPASSAAWQALGALFLVYALNYLDRTLIYILFKPIKHEMAFSDLQLALLGSTSFVIFYTTLGVPFGRLADRVSRPRMIAAGLALWSVASGLTGFMHDFTGIFLCRLLVGVGEATLGPAALSLLADAFPPRLRATAGALYSAGIPLGAGLALAVGGAVEHAWGWRAAFWMLGFPGLGLAAMVLWLRDPGRARAAAPAPAASLPATVASLLRSPRFVLIAAGYAMFAVAANALSMWIPSWLAARFDVPLAEVGLYTGAAAVVGGLVGASSGGWLADRFHARWERAGGGGRLVFSAICAVVSAGLWGVLLCSSTLPMALVPVFCLMGTGLMWLGPAAADVQDLARPEQRGQAIALYFLIVNAVGYGVAPPLIGALNDRVGGGTNPMAMAAVLGVCPVACVVAAGLLLVARRAR